MINRIKQSYGLILSVCLILFASMSLTACSGGSIFNAKLFKTRAAETPIPSDEGIAKSFFVNPSGQPKTFVCAWSPEMSRGIYGEAFLTLFANESMHCNVEFEIAEDYLIAKAVHPSYPEDRTRWREILKIPIRSHYYYERAKDPNGRETNEWIENSSRSHWTARPMMKLDMSGIRMMDFWGGFFGATISSVHDIEWDSKNGFLGFSADFTFNLLGLFGSEFQGTYRFNFLKFEHDPTFKKVPFHQENSRFMNILHVMGRKIEGVEPELYAARWDLRQPQNLYINGVPKQHEKTVIAAVEKWNATLREIKAIPAENKEQIAFLPKLVQLKHPFDLRYPAINWVSDKRISINSPLGIGMASADVRNGKILWGGVVLYGGILEMFVNRYAPIEPTVPASANGYSPLQAFSPILPMAMSSVPGLENFTPSMSQQIVEKLANSQIQALDREISDLMQDPKVDANKVAALREQRELAIRRDAGLNMIAQDLIQRSSGEVKGVGEYFAQRSFPKALGLKDPEEKVSPDQLALLAGNKPLSKLLKEESLDKRKEMLEGFSTTSSTFMIETELTVANMIGGWMNSPAQTTRTLPELLESVIMDLTLHEIGHFLGLGHQFKENILPHEGSVPTKYVKQLSEKATEAAGFTNYSSVMGYRNPRVEMMIPAQDLEPGPHDKLVLRYLYNSQYSSYDKAEDAWVFSPVPANGRIPRYSKIKTASGQVSELPTSYFPQCNDWDASLDSDPFCNRWDRGSKAEDIVKSYFEGISDNLLASLYSLVGGGGSPWAHEYRMWSLSFDTFSRVRLFYDEMRRRMRSEPHLRGIWEDLRRDQDGLFEFAQACQRPNPGSDQVKSENLRRLFAFPDMVDLCRANALALREFSFFLNLPDGDYTRIDHTNRYISGGYLEGDATRNIGYILGSWYQLSNLPLKFAAMYTLSTANPYHFTGRWLLPNSFYDSEENRFLYRTLYPREYTRLISSTVQNNMRFAATGVDDLTNLGKVILATSAFIPYQRYTSNDAARVPREFNEMLDQQTKFDMSLVAISITPVKPDANSNVKADHYKKFVATIYDQLSNTATAAREVYVLPEGQVLVLANGMFLYPITKLKFYNGTSAYVIAYKIAYDYEEGDNLVEDSVKSALLEKHNAVARMCVEGFNGNGLASYFDSTQADFDGFYIPPGIAEEKGKEKIGDFNRSIEEAFKKYEVFSAKEMPENFPIHSMRRVCDESLRGIGQISAAAALVNGAWLGITYEYVEK